MNIAFICNQNQARSQILSAVFSALLPTHLFSSYGLIAQENTPLPLVIDAVFTDWGLISQGRFAKNMGLHWNEISSFDLIIAVTTFIAEDVKNRGFKGEVVDLEQVASYLRISLTDPQLMPRQQCAFELSKYVKVSVSALQRTGVMPIGPFIKALMPITESHIEKAFNMALNEEAGIPLILIADLVAPQLSVFTKTTRSISRFGVRPYPSLLAGSQPTNYGSMIYVPSSAAMWPAKTYLTQGWGQFVSQIASEPMIMITPPLKNTQGTFAESYLAAMYAHEIQIVE